MLLEGKVCVLSGVGPGLGRQLALTLARHGADLVLGARTEPYLEEVAGEVAALGRRALPVTTDITDVEQCRRLAATARDELGRVDVLVNNAFRPDVFKRFEEVDLDDWRRIFDVNVFGTLQLTKEVAAAMKEQGGGSIVFVNSMVVRKVLPLQGGYAASKAALLTAAQVLAKELGPYRIRVNSVVPGWMWGPPVQLWCEWQAAERGVTAERVRDEIAAQIPLGAIPTDEECSRAVVFFASDLSEVVTGQALDVNGGEVFH